jgi:peptidoglycan/xylan/chitin deacetylase (PgdA/CDA1 family)
MPKTTIILYHDIDSPDKPSEKIGKATRETVVRLEEFESHMAWLNSGGYNVLSLGQYVKMRKSGKIPEKAIVLTFDDGHKSNYQYAFPILKRYSFSATFFIIAGNIGKRHYLSSDEIKEMAENGMEIGSHSISHTYLPLLGVENLRKETKKSKEIIESHIGKTVDWFAYPGGHLNRTVIDSVRFAGYKGAASCVLGRNNRSTNPFLFRRVEVRRGTSVAAFQKINNDSSLLFFEIIDKIKSGLKNYLGLNRYQEIREKLYFLYPFKR